MTCALWLIMIATIAVVLVIAVIVWRAGRQERIRTGRRPGGRL